MRRRRRHKETGAGGATIHGFGRGEEAATHDVIVIGAGAAGEAAGSLGAELGGRVAVIERELVGGECSFWACMPSKALLDAAGRRSIAGLAGANYPWERAAARRDWMIARTNGPMSDAGHVRALEAAGAEVVRGDARIVGPGRVEVRAGGRPRLLESRALVLAIGSVPVVPPIEGLAEAGYWTSRDATSVRDLPSSLVVLGGGPVGVEMAQVFVRFGVRTTLVEGNGRILARDHPLTSGAVADQLREEGLDIRVGVRATSVRRGGAGRVVTLDDGTVLQAAEVLVAVGRRPADPRRIGIEEAAVPVGPDGLLEHDERMRVGDGVYVAGDAAGGLQFTHVADYEGRIAASGALGREARADLASVPRAVYTYPPTGAVGLTVEAARERGIDAFEVTQDFSRTARGYTLEPRRASSEAILEGSPGHLTAVVDRERGILVGAFAACQGAPELIHEAVLAVKQRVPVAVLDDTIRAFPTAARVFGNLMTEAMRRLG